MGTTTTYEKDRYGSRDDAYTKNSYPLHINDGLHLYKHQGLPPTVPPAMAPAFDDFLDPPDGTEEDEGEVPVGVLVGDPADPVTGAVPVDSGASAMNARLPAKMLQRQNRTYLCRPPLQRH
jgi:hypothetical protein